MAINTHATIAGPRGGSLAHAEGELDIRRAPSGNLVLMLNRRPDRWSGEWPGNVMALFLTPGDAAFLGNRLTIAAADPQGVETEWQYVRGDES